MKEINRFFDSEDFEFLNNYARSIDYDVVLNPEDMVAYPDINVHVPDWAQEEILQRIQKETGLKLRISSCFFRITNEETGVAPHQTHTDSTMGRFTFLLYMQDAPEGVKAGTSLVKHKTVGGLHQDPWTQAEYDIWARDYDDYDAWTIYRFFEMEANKGVLYHSKLMHRAEPVGGFGKGIEDGRLVLTAFLDNANG